MPVLRAILIRVRSLVLLVVLCALWSARPDVWITMWKADARERDVAEAACAHAEAVQDFYADYGRLPVFESTDWPFPASGPWPRDKLPHESVLTLDEGPAAVSVRGLRAGESPAAEETVAIYYEPRMVGGTPQFDITGTWPATVIRWGYAAGLPWQRIQEVQKRLEVRSALGDRASIEQARSTCQTLTAE